MENIAILTGGDSAEYNISLLSANTVLKNLNKSKYRGFIVHIKDNTFQVLLEGMRIPISKEDFAFTLKGEKIFFSKVFMALHGPPAENGEIQPYFDNLRIPYTTCSSEVSSLTFDKFKCNIKLSDLGFNCAQSIIHEKGANIEIDSIIKEVKLPCFVKPNGAGSSYGISKVNKETELVNAIHKASEHDNEVLIESFVDGTEISCGVYFDGINVTALPITEIVSENDFFDYEAKYEGKSEEITPARINSKLTLEIQKTSISIYEKMKLEGICRIDYIIQEDIPFIIEINTIPGLSEESIIPQQLKTANISLSEVFDMYLSNIN
ncbi:MAG: ATP-grasp domain-containing protein [Flavobacteriales bacterium]|jgi:D-alanine-D-alanine ligase|nr:ATP-grasp domain-containing protein [Flavobacteriales bacterium]